MYTNGDKTIKHTNYNYQLNQKPNIKNNNPQACKLQWSIKPWSFYVLKTSQCEIQSQESWIDKENLR